MVKMHVKYRELAALKDIFYSVMFQIHENRTFPH